jgi:uncharacterized SAM-binding protein YcdF (DUF218 family)
MDHLLSAGAGGDNMRSATAETKRAESSDEQDGSDVDAVLMRRLRWLCWLLVALLAGGAVQLELLVILFPQKVLTIDSGEVKADAIVVLGGGLYARPERAAQLFGEGAAPKIVISGTGDTEQNAQTLEKNGVPADAIAMEGRSTSTLENAKFSVPLLRQMGAHRVIIVTSWYHSRRALACFEHFAPDIQFYSRPTYSGYETKEWDAKGVKGYLKSEYIKLPLYWLFYGVCPL